MLLYLLWPASPFVSACLHYAWLLVLVSPVKKLLQPGTCTRPLSLLLFQQQLDGLCMSDTVSTEPSRPCCLSAVRCDGRIFGQLYWCRSCTDGLAHLHSGVTPELLTAAQKPAGYQTCVCLMLSHVLSSVPSLIYYIAHSQGTISAISETLWNCTVRFKGSQTNQYCLSASFESSPVLASTGISFWVAASRPSIRPVCIPLKSLQRSFTFKFHSTEALFGL